MVTRGSDLAAVTLQTPPRGEHRTYRAVQTLLSPLNWIGLGAPVTFREDFLTLSGPRYRAFVEAFPTSTSPAESLYGAGKGRVSPYIPPAKR